MWQEAEGDLLSAWRWYESKRAGLGDEFLLCVEAVFGAVSKQPSKHRVVFEQVRRASTRRFPFGVLYFFDATTVYVVAVYHGSRDPDAWKDRLRSP